MVPDPSSVSRRTVLATLGGGRDRPMWRERLEAYLYALVGCATLEAFPPLRDAILDPD
ncbi:hypothetical protein PM035_02645 [Halorubrum ezzemoulense]|uniref:hypothetical protein n=1 Tax=Halorubrum ezzemoulense TaxID=337243 RepID=UPI00232AC217|nr:hypothetical protein [Halorubrum ezzemoulense]MDB2225658.1 hypothetical protein [Halorubrum ezzemoulense]MDB2260168.1 hypothetical protein [Halorubrum ezzemoulense]MDB2266598.1 hypothetical protein [Halorubrum ezzemoulense]MDB2271408.1 hypothetical protein [Halorubrum ezzemoulense]